MTMQTSRIKYGKFPIDKIVQIMPGVTPNKALTDPIIRERGTANLSADFLDIQPDVRRNSKLYPFLAPGFVAVLGEVGKPLGETIMYDSKIYEIPREYQYKSDIILRLSRGLKVEVTQPGGQIRIQSDIGEALPSPAPKIWYIPGTSILSQKLFVSQFEDGARYFATDNGGPYVGPLACDYHPMVGEFIFVPRSGAYNVPLTEDTKPGTSPLGFKVSHLIRINLTDLFFRR